jgi:hypothetical protein
MSDAYEFDVFLSYSRKGPVGEWVRNHFHPLLMDWLDSIAVHEPKIFVDWEQETGVRWPINLQRALKRSKCLVAVWSSQYFRSPWCVAEWSTMVAREKLLGFATAESPRGLVYPVVFSDGDNFPSEAKSRQSVDLRNWNYPQKQFRETAAYMELERKVQEITEELCGWIQTAPPWRDDWPLEFPHAYPEIEPVLPRIE